MLAAVWLSVASGARADEAVRSPDGGLASVDQAMARELDGPAGEQVATVGQRRLKLEAAGPVRVARDEAHRLSTLELPLGTQLPVQCFLYEGPLDTGATLARTVRSVAGKPGLTVASVRVLAIELVEKEPSLLAEVGYLVDGPGGKRAGQLKLFLVPTGPAPVMCLHDEPGYRKTFQRVAAKLAALLVRSTPTAGPAPVYRTLSLSTAGPMPVGFESSQLVKREDGSRVMVTLSTMVMARSPTEWMAQDIATTSELDAAGYVASRRVVVVANGEAQLDLTATRAAGGRYDFKGTASGKPLSGSFKAKQAKGLWSDVLITRAVRDELLTSKRPTLVVEQYEPTLNPLAVTVFTARRSSEGPRRIDLDAASLKMHLTVDERGDTTCNELEMGPLTLRSERKVVEGSLE